MARSLVWLLALVLALNYVDRSSLATAAPLIQQEFHLSSSELGWLLSAFFWVYTPAQVLGGWLVHRFPVRSVLGLGVLLWGAATALMGFAGGFFTLFLLRLLLALGECVTFPSIQLIVSRNALAAERGQVSSLISSGQGLGPLLGTLFGGLAMAAFGWRAMFIGLGLLTILWIWPWYAFSRQHLSAGHSHQSLAPISFLCILQCRAFWGLALGMFAGNYAFYFLFIWLPSYLVKAGGFSLTEMSGIVAAIYGIYALFVLLTGRVADRQIARGSSPTRVWKTVAAIGNLGVLLAIGACAIVNPRLAVWLLAAAGLSFGLLTPTLYSLTAIVPGPRAAGRWSGAQAVAGQLAGVVSSILTGLLIDRTGNYQAAFLVAGFAALVSLFCWCVILPKVETINWDPAS